MKSSKLQEHINNRHDGLTLRAMVKKNLCELKEPVLILKQPFKN